MQNSKKLLFFLSLILSGTLLFTSCSKDNDDNPDPKPEVEEGVATATIEFMDTEKTVKFKGGGFGAILTGSQDTVVMTFHGKDSPMAFWVVMTPAKEGELSTEQETFECYGLFWKDSTITDYSKVYSLGEGLEDEGEDVFRGEAAFNITALSGDHIKGSFTLTMVQYDVNMDNGEMKTKILKITNGAFDIPLFKASDFDVPE